jgi:hypothetical protein
MAERAAAQVGWAKLAKSTLKSAHAVVEHNYHTFSKFFRDPAVGIRPLGSVALSLCNTAHPLYTRFTDIIGGSVPLFLTRTPRRSSTSFSTSSSGGST